MHWFQRVEVFMERPLVRFAHPPLAMLRSGPPAVQACRKEAALLGRLEVGTKGNKKLLFRLVGFLIHSRTAASWPFHRHGRFRLWLLYS